MRSVPPAVAGGSAVAAKSKLDPPATAGGTDLITHHKRGTSRNFLAFISLLGVVSTEFEI